MTTLKELCMKIDSIHFHLVAGKNGLGENLNYCIALIELLQCKKPFGDFITQHKKLETIIHALLFNTNTTAHILLFEKHLILLFANMSSEEIESFLKKISNAYTPFLKSDEQLYMGLSATKGNYTDPRGLPTSQAGSISTKTAKS